MLVDKELVPHVFPASGEKVVLEHKDTVFVHLAQPGSSTLTGYTLRFSEPGVSTSASFNHVYDQKLKFCVYLICVNFMCIKIERKSLENIGMKCVLLIPIWHYCLCRS